MNARDEIESLIEPLLLAQTALIQHKVEEGDPQNGGQVKVVNDLIRNRDVAYDNLVAAFRSNSHSKTADVSPVHVDTNAEGVETKSTSGHVGDDGAASKPVDSKPDDSKPEHAKASKPAEKVTTRKK